MITPSTVKIVADVSGFNRDISSAENKMQSFGGVLGGLKTAAVGLGAAMLASAGVNGISAMVARSMQLRDANAKLADRLGITTQKVAGLVLQSELSGIGMDGMERALQKMTVRLQDAAEQGGPVADAIKKIGLNVYELASKKPDEAFFMISDAMKNMTNANEKLNSVSDIFGDKSLAITNMLNEGREGFALATQKATEFGTAISRVDAAKLEAANDSFTLMQESVDGLATRIGIRLSPMLQQMSENFASNTVAMAKMLGFRTEEEELNHLLASRAGLLKQIADIEAAAGGKVQGTAALSARADALRAEINLILNKQRTETEAFVASDKMRIVEEQATAKRLENSALETTAIKNKKVAIDAELQSMRDQALAGKELHAELMLEFNERAVADQLSIDQRVAGKINELNNIREINALEVEAAQEKAGYIMEIEEQQYQAQIARGESAFSTMLGNVSSHNKAFFKIQKLYRLSKLAMEAPAAIADSYAWGASWGGPPAGATMAGIAGLAMASYAGQLAGASFGGSGGGNAGGGGGSANPVTAPIRPGDISITQPPTQQSGSITINVNGVMTEDIVNNLIVPALQNAVENRDVILIRGDSRNAQQLMA